jgi:acyl-CoA reductase-like NAD-dependent aldehyde dehydrogenase
VIERHSPATGQLVATFASGTADDANSAVASARAAFDDGPWPRMSGIERAEVLLEIADRVRAERDTLARMEALEVGKTLRLARDDVDGAVRLIRHAAALAQQLHGELYTNLGAEYTGLVAREPVGVVAAIVPWNFPTIILAQKAPYALAAGCTVVVKPSEFTSGTALEFARIAGDAGLPAGALNVVTGYGDPVGRALVESPDVDMVSFTGSTATGLRILEGQKVNWKRVSLELGGKSANIVFADADLEDALDGALVAVFLNAGECCCSGTRLLVEDAIADSFVEELARRASALRVGDPLDERTEVGALISEAHTEQVLGFIDRGRAVGAELVTGGDRHGTCFVAPTIFDHVEPEMELFRSEIFGPVLSVSRFSGVDDAVRLANDSEYGLAASVWTKDLDKALTVSRRLRTGTVWVNTTIDGSPQLPFGGFKASGFGREMGNAGLEEFTEVKSVNIRHGKRPLYFDRVGPPDGVGGN